MSALRAYACGCALGTITLLLLGFLTPGEPLAARGDFAEIWAGPRAIVGGADPYARETWAATLASLTGRSTPVPVYVYPPHVALALVPLAFVPLPIAAALWTVGGAMAAVTALGALVRACAAPPLAAGLAGFALLASGPGTTTVAQGQWGHLLVAATALSVVLLRRGHHARAALAAAVLVAKPQLAIFALWALARRAAAARGRRFLVTGAAVLAVIAGTVLVFPGWWAAWLAGATAGFVSTHPVRAATLGTLLAEPLGLPGAIAAAAVVLGATLIALRFDARGDAGLAVGLALAPLAMPYGQAYDHVVLLVPLVLAVGVIAPRSRRRAEALGIAVSAVLIAVWPLLYGIAIARGRDTFTPLVPLTIFAMLVVALWHQPAEPV